MYQPLTAKNYQSPEKTHLTKGVRSTEGINPSSVKSSAMSLVIKHLLVQPHTCNSLVKKIGTYSTSYISHCLTRLKKAGLIGAVWDSRKVSLIYYNIKLEKVNSSEVE